MLNNPQWLWKNWPKVVFTCSSVLALVLSLTSLLIPQSFIATLLFYVNIAATLGAIVAFIKFDDVSNFYKEKTKNEPLLRYIREGNLKGIKELNKSKDELSLDFPDDEDPVGLSVIFNRTEILVYFLSLDVPMNKKFRKKDLPAILAMRMGKLELFEILQKHQNLTNDELEEEGMSQFMVDCFCGKTEKVLEQKKEFLSNQKDKWNLSPLNYAFMGNTRPEIIKHLLNLGSDINLKGNMIQQDPKTLAVSKKMVVPIHQAFEKLNQELILEMLKKEKKYQNDTGGVTVLMKAVEKSMLEVVKYLILVLSIADKDDKGLDAIGYARLSKNTECENILRSEFDVQKKEVQDNQTKQRSQDIALGVSQHDPNKLVKMEFDDILLTLQISLKGMVGVDKFTEDLAHEIKTFMDDKRSSKGIVLWGNSSVGKTEIGKRLCGLKEQVAKLTLPGVKFKYIACCDDDIDVKAIIESTENKTVLFLDEIDKYLSPSSGLVSEAQAKGLRTSIITNFERKEIFWIFAGTFLDMRGNAKLTRTNLEKTLGQELSSRLDFSDWKLNDWTAETLLKAAVSHFNQDSNVDYEDAALEKLVQYVLKHNGGVRGLEKAHESIKRANRTSLNTGSVFMISSKHVDEFMTKENADA